MCGISGIIDKSSKYSLKERINKMTNLIRHRGPDFNNTIVDVQNGFALGTTRLSILDLNSRSNQPFISKNNGNIITYNGEIYNYKKIKNNLENIGIKFYTNSDTEVLLEAYNYYGESVLEHLEGMFAFVVWDKKNKSFFCARDRLGIKPFIYYKDNEKFIFCSEISPIVSSYPELKKIKHSSIVDVINYGVVFQPETIFENIFFLKPGHWMKINHNLDFKSYKYWDVDTHLNKNVFFKNENEYLEYLHFNISETVKKQLVSDVNLGSLLSGGLDSAVISLIASKNINQKINNFNIYFENESSEYNESNSAKKISLLTKGNFFSQYISDEDGFNMMMKYIEGIDQPSCDGLNTFLVAKFAKNQTKVCLSGMGADEIFFGYGIHHDFIKSQTQTANIANTLLSAIFKIRPNNFCLNSYFKSMTPEEYFLFLRKIIHKSNKFVFNSNFENHAKKKNFKQKFLEYDNKNGDLKKRIFGFEIKNYLCNTLLRDSDVASMNNSVELRPVFLDHKLVELAASTTSYAFHTKKNSKIALRGLYKKEAKTDYTNKKIGFEIPFFKWMKNKRFNQAVNDFIPASNKIYSKEYIADLKKNIGKYNSNKESYNFLLLNIWLAKNNIVI
jgi:asparagine synthase (glutamine-hydrolysing)